MKIYQTAVKKPISTMLIFIGVITLGLFSLNNLSIDQYPEMDIPYVSVITAYSGANAADIETNITRILEDNLNTVNNLKKLTSTSRDNVSMVTLEMEWGCDLNEAVNDVRDVVSRVRDYLPDEVTYPTIFKFSSSMMPVMVLTATAEESYAALNKILDDRLVNTLNRIDGVGAVSLMGVPEREIQINVDPNKIDAYNLSIEQIGSIIANENINIPSGTIDIGNNTFNLKADGEFKSSDELKNIVVYSRDGKTVLLSEIATVKDTLEKATMDSRINGKKGIIAMVQKQSGANTVNIVNQIFKLLPQIQESLPKDINIDIVMDGSESIKDSISSLTETVMYAFIFVILVVMAFLGRWRATFIICLTIPISLITAFIYLYATGSTLNIISLSSLSIAIGMVVDDAIVVLENITTHIERGSTPKEAAVYATNEVWISVIVTTLVIVAVFLPLTLISGMMGIMFRELGWIVTIVVCVSTAVAISVTPMLSAYMLKLEGGAHNYKGMGIIYKPIDKFLNVIDIFYAKLLTWAVWHRISVLVITFTIFLSSLFLLSVVPIEFFPTSDNGVISATVQLEQNVSVEYTAKISRKIEGIVAEKYPEVHILSARAGTTSGSNAFAAMQSSGSHIINLMMRMPRSTERKRTIFEISDSLRKDFDKIPEIRQYLVSPGGNNGGSMGGASNVQLKVFGNDIDLTNTVALELKDRVSKEIKGTRDVQLSRDDMRPEYNVRFDKTKLAYYGMTSAMASAAVRNRIDGLIASKYREDGDEYDVVVRYSEEFRKSMDDIRNITLYNSSGQRIKLGEVATVNDEFAAPAIERENRRRLVSVNASLAPDAALGDVVKDVSALVQNYEKPQGVDIVIGGTIEDQQESNQDMLTLLMLIVILVYIVMATQFESFKMPFIIMFTIPFAFTGVFLALFLTGTPLSIIAMLGAVMLVGIVVKNGIVMVDYTNLLVERGNKIRTAVVMAGKSRLRPVLMTSLTTILGMLPLAISSGVGSEIWKPMGIAIVGGLTFSTMLTLLVIPVLYALLVSNKTFRRKNTGENEKQEIEELKRSIRRLNNPVS
ncbi:MAG: efflux RND transporter permease subunit [Prevotellaceae bacterium]|jgi:HAE1 family hydrophobic/amphiphilic exporter-1|nr:efflux RND transporter permease subunit [Prevotellaceae bacterium]